MTSFLDRGGLTFDFHTDDKTGKITVGMGIDVPKLTGSHETTLSGLLAHLPEDIVAQIQRVFAKHGKELPGAE